MPRDHYAQIEEKIKESNWAKIAQWLLNICSYGIDLNQEILNKLPHTSIMLKFRKRFRRVIEQRYCNDCQISVEDVGIERVHVESYARDLGY